MLCLSEQNGIPAEKRVFPGTNIAASIITKGRIRLSRGVRKSNTSVLKSVHGLLLVTRWTEPVKYSPAHPERFPGKWERMILKSCDRTKLHFKASKASWSSWFLSHIKDPEWPQSISQESRRYVFYNQQFCPVLSQVVLLGQHIRTS